MRSRHALTIAVLVLLVACAAPAPGPMAFAGHLSGVPATAAIAPVGEVWYLELHAFGGDAGSGAVTAPAEVFVEVVSTPAADAGGLPATVVMRPAMSSSGVLEARLGPGMASARAGQLEAIRSGVPGPPARASLLPNVVGDVVAIDFAVFNDSRGATCRIDARLPVGGPLDVVERACAVDRDPGVRFTGALRPSGRPVPPG